MDAKRLTVVVGLVGAALGAGLDIFFSIVMGWGYSFVQNILCSIAVGALLFFVARSALSQGGGEREQRVEQVTGKKRKVEDCYESIVVQQERY